LSNKDTPNGPWRYYDTTAEADADRGQQKALLEAIGAWDRALHRGDEEGCLRLHQLPTPEQAAVIRDIMGIRKKQEISSTTLERLKAFSFPRKPRNEARKEP
jgi:hypothetical protein